MIQFKRKVKFHDDENLLVISELKITHRNGYPEFTMCNEKNGGSGQTNFIPKEGPQTELYNIWDQYHLNGMNAGLPIQVKAITEWKKTNKYDYDKICEYLKSINLYELPLKANLPEGFFITGKETITDKETYKYGHGWVHCILDPNFDDTLERVCDEIEEEEQARFEDGEFVTWEDIEDEKIVALGKFLELTPKEAQEDISGDDCNYSYSGIEYLVYTDSEADDLWEEELDNYLEQCIYPELPDNMRNYFDDDAWKSDAKMDGRGHSLNRYDGNEDEENVNGTCYYIYKQ